MDVINEQHAVMTADEFENNFCELFFLFLFFFERVIYDIKLLQILRHNTFTKKSKYVSQQSKQLK